MNETTTAWPDTGSSLPTATRTPVLTPVDPRQELERVPEILRLASKLTGTDLGSTGPGADFDHRTALRALAGAERAASERLAQLATGPADAAQRLVAPTIRLHQMQVFLRDSLFNERTHSIMEVQRALQRLRSAQTLDQLVDRIPEEIHGFGFRRALVSRIDDSRWIARAAFVQEDPKLAEAMVSAGSANPRQLTHVLPEAEMLRRRQSILIPDAQSNPRIHPELKDVTRTKAYVAAPVMSGADAIGLLHADEATDSTRVEDFHREVLGMFAEGIGYAVERTVLHDRLRTLRNQLQEHTARVNDIVDEFVDSDIRLNAGNDTAPIAARVPRTASPPADEADSVRSLLTHREQDVFRLMAIGHTNARIASNLIVSEGTVKSHVKHILRKLGAANRAEAVSRFYRSDV